MKLVSPARAQALAGLGVRTVRDLLTHFPRRYIDLSKRETVAGARIGGSCTIQGSVHEVKLKRPRPNLTLVEIAVVDATGVLMVTCFRQPWLKDQLKPGMGIAVAGKVEFDYGFKRMVNPYIEQLGDGQMAEGMIIPVHPACEKISAAWMRRLVGNALDAVQGCYDPLPLDLRVRYRLMARGAALSCIHFPHAMEEVAEARRRLVYEELLLLELALMSQAAQRAVATGASPPRTWWTARARLRSRTRCRSSSPRSRRRLVRISLRAWPRRRPRTTCCSATWAPARPPSPSRLPRRQTRARRRRSWRPPRCSRASMARRWEVVRRGRRHLGPAHGFHADDERARLLARAAGAASACSSAPTPCSKTMCASSASLAVIDEQQRFGVEQRAALLWPRRSPDALYLTATPIPRTLALAVFGDMTLSTSSTVPTTRAPHHARRVEKADQRRAYDAARGRLRGEQVYVVCPLIGQDAEARDKRAGGRGREADEEAYEFASISIESDDDFAGDNVTAAARGVHLQQTVFADWHVELLHGRMKPADKAGRHAGRFRDNETQVLVATTVIEVGVDAERHGHDRHGRRPFRARSSISCAGASAAARSRRRCFWSPPRNPDAVPHAPCRHGEHDDGFELAKYDLSLRREGDILGNRQTGRALKLVNVVRDGAGSSGRACRCRGYHGRRGPQSPIALALELHRVFRARRPQDSRYVSNRALWRRGEADTYEDHRRSVPRAHAGRTEGRAPAHHRPRARGAR